MHLQFYLRQWSLQLDVPIVSIDYSLAPEAPFPRALEECVMAYAWMLLNMEQLGIYISHCPIVYYIHVSNILDSVVWLS